MIQLSQKDIKTISQFEITKEMINHQYHQIQKGFPHLMLNHPCTTDHGVKILNDLEKKTFIQYFDEQHFEKKIVKFVPASGAASRMFKSLINQNQNNQFIENIQEFAFYHELEKAAIKDNLNLQGLINNNSKDIIISLLLEEHGLNYKNLPKGLIKFHVKNNQTLTPLEEHILESSLIFKDSSHIHFTISINHLKDFESISNRFIQNNKLKNINITYSEQKRKTDSISLGKDGSMFRDEHGQILLRPSGHGALLDNLNDLAKQYDIAIIKNIDNVQIDPLQSKAIDSFKALTGYLMDTLKKFHAVLHKIDQNKPLDDQDIQTINQSLKYNSHINSSTLKNEVHTLLNRPLRICGMVKNKGETGGLPFVVSDSTDNKTLQIVENSQFDMNNPQILKMIQASTHFNPVFLTCSLKNYKNEAFDLHNFANLDSGLVVKKNYQGTDILTLEKPGLWNGAMYHWNTIFVEIPESAFTPVKTIFDLLKPMHKN